MRNPGHDSRTRSAASARNRVLRTRTGSLSLRKSTRLPRPGSSPGPEGRPWARPIFLGLLIILAQFVFLHAELFKVHSIKVLGNLHTTRQAVLDQSGLKTGAYLWQTSAHHVALDIARIPQVKEATVSYALPGKVTIHVSERQPVFQVAMRAKQPQWLAVDEEGMVLRALPQGSNKLPRLVVDEPVPVGTHVDSHTLLTVLKAVSWVGTVLPEAVWYYYVDDRGGVTIKTAVARTPLEVHLGELERMDYKVKLLGALLDHVATQKQKVLSVDLRYASPLVKLRDPLPGASPTPSP